MSNNQPTQDENQWIRYFGDYIEHYDQIIEPNIIDIIQDDKVHMNNQNQSIQTQQFKQTEQFKQITPIIKSINNQQQENLKIKIPRKRKGPSTLDNDYSSQNQNQNQNDNDNDNAITISLSDHQKRLLQQIQQREQKQLQYNQQNQGRCGSKKQLKQHIYSRKYRQRKKQAYKIMQQQNLFLKKKLKQLQSRLYQAQTQVNRLKYSLPQQKINLLQSNQRWLSIIKQLLESNSTNEDTLSKEFSQHYDVYGFAGKAKIDKMNYHMNQFLQHVLKDSQKYMALSVINNVGLLQPDEQDPLNQYQHINYTIFEVIQFDQVKIQTIKKFLGPFLKPAMQKIQIFCQQLYQKFRNVIDQVLATHNFLKASRDKDFLTIKQRLQIQNWFQLNKYTKQLRNLRADWIQSLKQQKQDQQKNTKKKKENKIK